MTGSEVEYGVVIAKDVMVPMRDGVRLATDIYRPALDGEPVPGHFPTILGRTSYDKIWPDLWIEPVASFFTPRGYAVVLQDLRGRHRSEGTGQYFHACNPREGEDGYDTIEWIASQPWSNGRVGMVGSSHGGIVQTAALLERPPHLTAIWSDVAPTNYFTNQSRQGGAIALQMFGALFLHAHDAQEIRDDPAGTREIIAAWENMRELVTALPFKPGHTPLRVVPNLEKILFDYYYRGEYDEFWAQACCDQERYFDRAADIPAVFSGGWYDPFSVATTSQYAALTEQHASPQRLLMGPWNHGGMRAGATFAGDVDFGPEAKFGNARYNELRLRWFDRWLKDQSNGVDVEAPVRLFVMGGGDGRRNSEGRLNHGGHWREEREWPLSRARLSTYYLRSGGALSAEPPGKSDPSASYTHDPENPIPTVGGNVTALAELVKLPAGVSVIPRARMRSIVQDGGAHQQPEPGMVGAQPPYLPLAMRPDVLVFQTEALAEAVEVTGAIEVKLWIASSAVDTDFTAKLIDVYPPNPDYPTGYHLGLADSIIRARYRNGFERPELMEPEQVYEVGIGLPPISNVFQPGHRIRIDVASSNLPRFDVNPNTGEPMGRHTHMVRARNTIYLDSAHPSHIVVPIIPVP
ncbi:MAG: antibiotic hydrolase [Dehalococcoidia bacterium]|nr:antibiotic hydrolase [Dehalococcoidia bacterium]